MDQQEQGLTIAISPVQLAAVLKSGTISEAETLSNRLWGGVNIVAGVIELMGAGVLCAAPDPTMMTKAGCIVLGVHGLDTINTGSRQIISGLQERSSTQYATSEAAKIAGAQAGTATNIGLNVDIAVALPFGMLKGVARVASVSGGTFKLSLHEAAAGSRVGGHAIAKHVGKTEAELRVRLLREGKDVVSSFHNLSIAERAVSETLKKNAAEIEAWAKSPSLRHRPRGFNCFFDEVVGHGVVKISDKLILMSGARVILKYQTYNGMPYYILTAHPI